MKHFELSEQAFRYDQLLNCRLLLLIWLLVKVKYIGEGKDMKSSHGNLFYVIIYDDDLSLLFKISFRKEEKVSAS